jgi:hypothetical protein
VDIQELTNEEISNEQISFVNRLTNEEWVELFDISKLVYTILKFILRTNSLKEWMKTHYGYLEGR